MIEFYGEISTESKKYLINRERNIGIISCSIICSFLIVLVLLLSIFINWLFITLLTCVLAIMLCSLIKPKGETLKLFIPHKITIDFEGKTIISEGEKFYCTRYFSEIKKIIDNGTFYQIIFYFPHKSTKFLCQKNLLSKGSLDEFESYFKDRINKG